MNSKTFLLFALTLLGRLLVPVEAAPPGSAFTYQGRLSDADQPANGSYDLRAVLYTADLGGSQVGPIVNVPAVTVAGGVFTTELDFGPGAFNGESRWVELFVRRTGVAAYTRLDPRQAITSAPFAQFALTPAGPQGVQGPAGAVGAAGPKGDKGDTGPVGSTGLTGSQGAAGPTGASGPQGAKGDTGLTGPAGAVGPQGIQGVPGAVGPAGPQGTAGPQGPSGAFTLAGDTASYVGGNVGIGTANPTNKLTVRTPTLNYGIEHTDGDIRLGTFVGRATGYLGTLSNHNLTFFANDNGLENMTMTLIPGGNVGIGTATPNHKLEVAGNTRINGELHINKQRYLIETVSIAARPDDAYAFNVYDSSGTEYLLNVSASLAGYLSTKLTLVVENRAFKTLGGTAWEVWSDRRLKQDVRPYDSGLSEVLQLRPVRFRYRDGIKEGLTSVQEEVGFIAQEVREIIPEAVAEGKDGYLTLKADPIHWAAINAIQQLNAKLEAKDARIAALERSVAELKQLMGALAADKRGAQ